MLAESLEYHNMTFRRPEHFQSGVPISDSTNDSL